MITSKTERTQRTYKRRQKYIISLNHKQLNPQTPRTQRACQELAIKPEDLIEKSFQHFYDPSVHPDIQKLRYEAHLKNVQLDRQKVLKYKEIHIDPIAAINLSIGDRAQLGIKTIRECKIQNFMNEEDKKVILTQDSQNSSSKDLPKFLKSQSYSKVVQISSDANRKLKLKKIDQAQQEHNANQQIIEEKKLKIQNAEKNKSQLIQSIVKKNSQRILMINQSLQKYKQDQEKLQRYLDKKIQDEQKAIELRNLEIQKQRQRSCELKEVRNWKKKQQILQKQQIQELMEKRTLDDQFHNLSKKISDSQVFKQVQVETVKLKLSNQNQKKKIILENFKNQIENTNRMKMMKMFEKQQQQNQKNKEITERMKQVTQRSQSKHQERIQLVNENKNNFQNNEWKIRRSIEQKINDNFNLIEQKQLQIQHQQFIKQERKRLKEQYYQKQRLRSEKLEISKKLKWLGKERDDFIRVKNFKDSIEQISQTCRENTLKEKHEKERFNELIKQYDHYPESTKLKKKIMEYKSQLKQTQYLQMLD